MNSVLITVLAVVVLATSYQHEVQAKPSPEAAAFLKRLIQKGEIEAFQQGDKSQEVLDMEHGYEPQGSIQESCDCCYSLGRGCRVCQAAPANKACYCEVGFFRCSGTVTNCEDWTHYYCKHPDTGYTSCMLGGGNCQNYF